MKFTATPNLGSSGSFYAVGIVAFDELGNNLVEVLSVKVQEKSVSASDPNPSKNLDFAITIMDITLGFTLIVVAFGLTKTMMYCFPFLEKTIRPNIKSPHEDLIITYYQREDERCW